MTPSTAWTREQWDAYDRMLGRKPPRPASTLDPALAGSEEGHLMTKLEQVAGRTSVEWAAMLNAEREVWLTSALASVQASAREAEARTRADDDRDCRRLEGMAAALQAADAGLALSLSAARIRRLAQAALDHIRGLPT